MLLNTEIYTYLFSFPLKLVMQKLILEVSIVIIILSNARTRHAYRLLQIRYNSAPR